MITQDLLSDSELIPMNLKELTNIINMARMSRRLWKEYDSSGQRHRDDQKWAHTEAEGKIEVYIDVPRSVS